MTDDTQTAEQPHNLRQRKTNPWLEAISGRTVTQHQLNVEAAEAHGLERPKSYWDKHLETLAAGEVAVTAVDRAHGGEQVAISSLTHSPPQIREE